VTRDEETLRAARARIAATLEETRRQIAQPDEEHAGRVLADLWTTLAAHGATDDMLRSVVNLPALAISTIDVLARRERALAALGGKLSAAELLASPGGAT
jgi:hypothetical protein